MATRVKRKRKAKAVPAPEPEEPQKPPRIVADFVMHPEPFHGSSLNWESPSNVGTLWKVTLAVRGGFNVYRVTARGRRRGVERVQYHDVEDKVTHEVNLDFFDKWKGARFVDLAAIWRAIIDRDRRFRQGWAKALYHLNFGKNWAAAKRKAKRHGEERQSKGKAQGKARKTKVRNQAGKARTRK